MSRTEIIEAKDKRNVGTSTEVHANVTHSMYNDLAPIKGLPNGGSYCRNLSFVT